MRKWRITYLPHSRQPGCIEWVFQGSEFDLDEYLQNHHSCQCSDCDGVYWWDTPQSYEYHIEEITEGVVDE